MYDGVEPAVGGLEQKVCSKEGAWAWAPLLPEAARRVIRFTNLGRGCPVMRLHVLEGRDNDTTAEIGIVGRTSGASRALRGHRIHV
jgi:hypothetical protein